MAVFLEIIDAGGNVARLPVQNGRIDVAAQPGTIYRLVDENGASIGSGPRVLRVDDDLIVDGLPAGEIVGVTDFFTDCTPAAPCTLSLAELGGGGAANITPVSEPVAALQEGAFLMYTDDTSPQAVPVEPSSDINWKPLAAIGGGLLVVAGVAGGGGGGGGGDSSPPAAPTLQTTTVNNGTPVLQGQAEANARVTITITLGDSGQQVRYATTADRNGNWEVDLATAEPLVGTLPATGLPTDAASSISLVATDSAGNASQGGTASVVVDTTPPIAVATLVSINDDFSPVTGAIAPGASTNDTRPTLTGTISAPLEAGDMVVVLRDGVVAGQASVSGTNFTFTDSARPEGTINYSVQVRDAAGNATAATAPVAIVVDVTPPGATTITAPPAGTQVTAAIAAGGLTVSGTVEPGTGATEVQVTIGGATQTVAVNASNQWTAVFQSAQLPADAPTTPYNIVASAIDAAGNVGAASAPVAVTIDRNPPTATLSSDGGTVTNDAFTVTFDFGENVIGFAANDIAVSGATLVAGSVSGSGGVYTADFLPTANAQGNAVVNLVAGAVTDAAGNPSVAGSVTQAFDRIAPTLNITDNVNGTASGPITFTFNFGEAVTGFTAADITVTGGAAGALTATTNPGVYTMVVTPGPAVTGNVVVSVGANAAVDAAGNGSSADAQTQGFTLDNTPPTLVITDNGGATATGPVLFTFTFSEPVTGFTAADVNVTNGTAGALNSNANGNIYTMTVTPAANSNGVMTVTVPANSVQDAAGNNNADTITSTQPFNTELAPTVTITNDATGPNPVNGNVTYTFTFSEDVSDFQTNDLSVSNGTVLSIAGSGDTYTAVVRPDADETGNMVLTLAEDAVVADGVGNAEAVAAPVAFDTERPAPTITDAAPAIATGPVTYTIDFGEPVTGFTAADLTITSTGGTAVIGPLNTSNAATGVYQITVTPEADSFGVIRVGLAANAAADQSGNNNTAAAQNNQSYNTTIPAATTGGTVLNITTQDLLEDNAPAGIAGFGAESTSTPAAEPAPVALTGNLLPYLQLDALI